MSNKFICHNGFKHLFVDCLFFMNYRHFYLIEKLILITFFVTFYKKIETFGAKNC